MSLPDSSHVSELTMDEARQLVVTCQGLAGGFNCGDAGALAVVEHLGYVQIDSISVAQRAHQHTLWNRTPDIEAATFENLRASAHVFEYWAHAAAFLPMRDFRFTLPRKHAFKAGQGHWFERDPQVLRYVRDCIAERGPMMAKDFKDVRAKSTGWWDWQPSKRALEQLYMQGELMVVARRGFHKVYDLTERVLPENVETTVPTTLEYSRYLINGYLRAQGVALSKDFGYLLKNIKPQLRQGLLSMLESGEVVQVKVAGERYYARASIEAQLHGIGSTMPLKILSPFDNLVIQRERLSRLFDYDYQLECYTPHHKRRYGYFCMPLLAGTSFIGCVDLKVERTRELLVLKHLVVECKELGAFCAKFAAILPQFMHFQGARFLIVQRITYMGEPMSKASTQQFERELLSSIEFRAD
ncbi:MAG: winged helix-turn-helix domain-containing protein [Pseudomonadales bacterium]